MIVASATVLFLVSVVNTTGVTYSHSQSLFAEFTGAAIFCWYLCLFADWTLHNLGHLRMKGNLMFQVHMEHHKVAYPVGKLLRPGPYIDGGGAMAFGPWIVALWYAIFRFSPSTRVAGFIFGLSAVFLLVSDYLHIQYHVKDSWLETALGDWFLERRRYHFHHHNHLKDNMSLGGISTLVDRLCGSYWNEKARAKPLAKYL